MQTVRVGIIGCGRVAGFLEDDPLRGHPCTHVGAYQCDSEMQVVACCSRDIEQAARFAERFSIPRFYADYRDLLRNETLDILSIAAYAPSRCEMTIAAARSGIKALFCEKAMATSLQEADRMISVCRQYGVLLAVNHTRRWEYDYQRARALIDEGGIGTLQSIQGSFSGNLVHTGIHMFDCMLYFAGPAETVWGTVRTPHDTHRMSSGYQYRSDQAPIQDGDGVATIQFKSGVIGQIIGLGKKYFTFELDLLGTEGRIKLANGVFEHWRMSASKKYTGFQELERQKIEIPCSVPSAMITAVKDIKDALMEKRETLSSGVEARKSLEIALAIYESHSRGGAGVGVPLRTRTRRVISR